MGTHLGYERTKLAVRDILNNLKGLGDKKNVIKVHILLHWPRCYDDVKWMNCEDEEKNLPDRIKNAGPAPHLDPDNAFIESWNALEEFYTDEGILRVLAFPTLIMNILRLWKDHVDFVWYRISYK